MNYLASIKQTKKEVLREITRLTHLVETLNHAINPTNSTEPRVQRVISAKGREAMSRGQKRRFAKLRRGKGKR